MRSDAVPAFVLALGLVTGCSAARDVDPAEPTTTSPNATAGSISPSASVPEMVTIDVGRWPLGIAYGSGSVWVATADALVRVDAASDRVLATIPLPKSLRQGSTVPGDPAIANWVAVGEGGVWMTVARRRLSVVHVDPRTESITTVIDVGSAPNRPTPLAVGLGGVWVPNFSSHELVKIDPERNRVIRSIPLEGSAPVEPSGVALAAGSVWVMDHASSTLLRIDPMSGLTVDRVQVVTSGRLSSLGNTIWAASAGGDAIQSVDAARGRPDAPIDTCAGVNNVSPAGGSLWVATSTATLCQLDAAGETVRTFDLPAAGGIAIAHGNSAWISLPEAGAIAAIRI